MPTRKSAGQSPVIPSAGAGIPRRPGNPGTTADSLIGTHDRRRQVDGVLNGRRELDDGRVVLLDNGDTFYYPGLDGEQFSYLSAGVTFRLGLLAGYGVACASSHATRLA